MNTDTKILLAFLLGIIIRILLNPWILGFYNINFTTTEYMLIQKIFSAADCYE